jgi:hydrogenase small subunit
MNFTRRDFFRASSLLAAAWGMKTSTAYAAGNTGPTVVWLQAAGCSGCSVSLLNSIHYMTVDTLLANTINLKFHSTLMSGAGEVAVEAAEAAREETGYILVVEGAIPTGDNGEFCHVWPGKSAHDAVLDFAPGAAYIMAIGACAAFGGIPGAMPNPTGCEPLSQVLPDMTVVNIPGCPSQPDWVVGTVAHILANGEAPPLDENNCPLLFFEDTVHKNCLRKPFYPDSPCLFLKGCKGPETRADCPTRKWNGGMPGQAGQNWCVDAGSPCLGCANPTFPDGTSPFHETTD